MWVWEKSACFSDSWVKGKVTVNKLSQTCREKQPPLSSPIEGWPSLQKSFTFSLAPEDTALSWVRREESLRFPQTRWMATCKKKPNVLYSTFPRYHSIRDIQKQTHSVSTNFSFQDSSMSHCRLRVPAPSYGLILEATGTTEPKGAENLKLLRLQPD